MPPKRISFSERISIFKQRVNSAKHSGAEFYRELRRYPSALFGIALILILVIISIGTVIAIPYNRAISLWRGDDQVWLNNPMNAPPAWINFFRKDKLPETIKLNSQDGSVPKVVDASTAGKTNVTMSFSFDYNYDTLPQDVMVRFNPIYEKTQPFVTMTWITPDGREILLRNMAVSRSMFDLFDSDTILKKKFGKTNPVDALFNKPGGRPGEALKGIYTLKIERDSF